MSTTGAALRGVSYLGRRGLQYSRGLSTKTSAREVRVASSKYPFKTIPPSQLVSPGKQMAYKNSNSLSAQGRRPFSATSKFSHGHWEPPKPGDEIFVTFVDKEGDEHRIAVNKGDNLLTIAQGNDIEMEGACEGSCSCSTCHVIVENEEMYDKIPEATDDENDMLDLAFGLTETSRLGCQIVMTKDLDGLRVKLPSMTRNLQASDFSKKS